MTVSLTGRIRMLDDVMVRKLDGESVILNLKSETYYGLDNVGTRCWEHLADSPSIQSACEKVSTRYGIDLEIAQTDIVDLVQNLLEQGLVEVENGNDVE